VPRLSVDAASDLAVPPRPRLKVALGAVVVLIIAALGIAVVAGMLAPRGASSVVDSTPAPSTGEVDIAALTVVVHVLGAVREPGLYTLPEGSRVIDAVAAAGGFADGADRGGVNLARVIVDAEQIRIPTPEEAAAGAASAGTTTDGLVRLNSADQATLETLPRVGPAMAARIIALREERGGFRSIEELRDVSGIGDKTFEALKPLVTL